MPITDHHHTTSHRTNRALSRRLRLWHLCLGLLAALLVLTAASYARAAAVQTSAAGPFVESVAVNTGADDIEVNVTTTAGKPPFYIFFPLREPNRLVMDLPDFAWKPGLTAHLPSSHVAIDSIRVGQFSSDPPVTRVVFDLTVPAQELRYRTLATTADGNLRVSIVDQAHAAPGQVWSVPQPAKEPLPDPQAVAKHPAPAPAAAASTPPTVEPEPEPEPVADEPLLEGEPEEEPVPAPVATPAKPELVRPRVAAETPPPVRQDAGGLTRAHLIGIIVGLAIVCLAGILALRLRRRSAGETAADLIALPAAPTGRQPSTDSDDVLRCKILDGYLVLAPEGGRKAPDPDRVRTAKVEGSVELTLDSRTVAKPDQPAEEEPSPDVSGEIEELVTSLADENVAVRKAAAQGLWDLARHGATADLLPYLKHEDPRVRLVIAGVLGEAGAADCAGALADIAADPDPAVRATVLYSFAQLGEKAVQHAGIIRSRLSDSEDSVRARAVEALAAVSPKSESVARELLALSRDDDPSVREAAAACSYEFVLRGVTGPFIGLLADISSRGHALELLQQAEEDALRRLLIAARNAPSESGERALETLSYVMSRRWTVDDFRQELASSDSEVRLAAVEGLAMIGGEEAMKELGRLAKGDSSAQVKDRAAEILRGWQEVTADVTGAGADD